MEEVIQAFNDQDVRYLGLRMRRTDPPAFPSLEEIESERYGLAKVIYVYLPADPSPTAVLAIDFLLSEAGRRAIESTDLWPVPRERDLFHNPARPRENALAGGR